MASVFDKIKQWFRQENATVKEEVEGGEPVATPPEGSGNDPQRETSTNAQTAGAADEPWSGSS